MSAGTYSRITDYHLQINLDRNLNVCLQSDVSTELLPAWIHAADVSRVIDRHFYFIDCCSRDKLHNTSFRLFTEMVELSHHFSTQYVSRASRGLST